MALSTTAHAEGFAHFNCEAGDINYSVSMPEFLPPYVTVTVSVSEAVDPKLNRVLALNRTTETGGATLAYIGSDIYDGQLRFSASSADTVRLSFAGGQSLACVLDGHAQATDTRAVNAPNSAWAAQERAEAERAEAERIEAEHVEVERARLEQMRQLTTLRDVVGYSLGGQLYSHPSADYDRIARVNGGRQLEIIGRTAMQDDGYTWYKVRARGRTGYMWGGELCYAYDEQPGTYGSCRAQGIDVPLQWMVIATDNRSRAREGVHINRREARRLALNACGSGCEVVQEGQHLCHAYARSRKDGYWLGVDKGYTLREARRSAQNICERYAKIKGTCKVRITTCQDG